MYYCQMYNFVPRIFERSLNPLARFGPVLASCSTAVGGG